MARELRPLVLSQEQIELLAEISPGDELAARQQAENDQTGVYAALLAAIILGRALRPGESPPKFRYNPATGQYITADGRVIPASIVRKQLDSVLAASSKRMKAASSSLREGNVTLAQWQTGMMTEIKSVILIAAALGRGGWEQMTTRVITLVEGIVSREYQFLARFASQIARGQQRLDGTLASRASMYSSNSRKIFYENRQATVIGLGYDQERSVLGVADHCQECIDQDALGWQPMGQMIPIGERTCRGNCQCTVEYRKG